MSQRCVLQPIKVGESMANIIKILLLLLFLFGKANRMDEALFWFGNGIVTDIMTFETSTIESEFKDVCW